MPTYNELVGKRLRSIRKQRGLSLQDVQRLSSQEFKAAVLGAYERGERSLLCYDGDASRRVLDECRRR